MSAIPTGRSALRWTRIRYGRGFQYRDEVGQKIKDPAILKRLRGLVIPPNWEEVLICQSPHGKVQAVGRDGKGRKQYIYHPNWEQKRQLAKFRQLPAFGRALPELRRYCQELLSQRGWTRRKVIALMIMVLDETGIRIGNRQYLRKNDTYGLTTLRRRHLDIEDEALVFNFKGKSGKSREVRIEDQELIPFVRRAAEQPGYEIFRYRSGQRWENIDSEDINEFIQEMIGARYSSKFFRTWVANRTAIEKLAEARDLKEGGDRRRFANIVVKLVANELGNTPSVCRNYYLHPTLLRHIEKKPVKVEFGDSDSSAELSSSEALLLHWISPGK